MRTPVFGPYATMTPTTALHAATTLIAVNLGTPRRKRGFVEGKKRSVIPILSAQLVDVTSIDIDVKAGQRSHRGWWINRVPIKVIVRTDWRVWIMDWE